MLATGACLPADCRRRAETRDLIVDLGPAPAAIASPGAVCRHGHCGSTGVVEAAHPDRGSVRVDSGTQPPWRRARQKPTFEGSQALALEVLVIEIDTYDRRHAFNGDGDQGGVAPTVSKGGPNIAALLSDAVPEATAP